MTCNELSSFEEAIRAFQTFLAVQGWPTELNWVPEGGVVFRKGQLYVRALS